jgi:hypothetical protein
MGRHNTSFYWFNVAVNLNKDPIKRQWKLGGYVCHLSAVSRMVSKEELFGENPKSSFARVASAISDAGSFTSMLFSTVIFLRVLFCKAEMISKIE